MKSNHFIIFLCVVFALSYLTVIIAAEEQNGGLETLPDFKIGEKKQAEKEGKLFALFSIVSFKNQVCASSSAKSGGARNGTCYTASECSSKGGTASGNCASGFGVCCLFLYNTGSETISANNSYIQNPNYPSAYASTTSITWTVKKCSDDVCTLRLDFCTFTLAGPTGTTDGSTPASDTTMDTFTVTVSPSSSPIPLIAGENTGEHIYIELGTTSTASTTLAFAIGTSTTVSRIWEIRVAQIECWNTARPYDTGCLQYHTGSTGRIESFNFGQSSSSNYQHLHSQDYAICIRKEAGMCCVEYYICSDTGAYSISSSEATSTGGTNCSTDYLIINGGTASCDLSNAFNSENIFCGAIFNAADTGTATGPICDCTTPFQIVFHTNTAGIAETIATVAQRGFCLEYNQVGC